MEKDYETEVAEAVNAANDALYHLYNADEMLSKARNWGIADIMGGGMIITAVKRKKMREASDEMRSAHQSLKILNRELLDLNGFYQLDTEIDDFLGVADYVFDNFMTDILSQSRINNARGKVQDLIAQVEGILDALSEI